MRFVVLGLNHKTAPLAVREGFSLSRDQVDGGLEWICERDSLLEGVILSTCNRTEFYAVVENGQDGRALLEDWAQFLSPKSYDRDAFYYYEEDEAMSHLFKVAASLDSLVLGEGQILSQVKEAYSQAYKKGVTGTLLNIVFQRAIAIGKKVRTETAVAGRPISVSYTAVTLAEKALPQLEQSGALILGAGTMAELTAIHLRSKGVRSIFVSNRTFAKAQALAEKLGGQAVSFTRFMEQAQEADVIITSTGAPHYIITLEGAQAFMEKRQGRPLVMIDIAVPRDIDPQVGDLPGVSLYNMDSLESVVEENKQMRQEEAQKALALIAEALVDVKDKLSYLPARPLMVQIAEKAERVRLREFHRLMVKMPHVTDGDRRLIETMSRMLVRKLLREPMIHVNEVVRHDEDGTDWRALSEMFKIYKEAHDED